MTLNYYADVDRPPPGGSIVHAAPISHGSGLWNFPMVGRGSVQVFPESGKYEVPETVELMNRWPECSIFLAPTMVKRLIEHLRSDPVLLYASDFPHWQFDGDETMPAGIPAGLRRKILVENPLATYDRLNTP